jgi:hypothetical protein
MLRAGDGVVMLLARVAPEQVEVIDRSLREHLQASFGLSEQDVFSWRGLGPYELIIVARTNEFDRLDALTHMQGLKKLEVLLCYEYISEGGEQHLFEFLQTQPDTMVLHAIFLQVEGHLALQYGQYAQQAVARTLLSDELKPACEEAASRRFVLGTLGTYHYVLLCLTSHCDEVAWTLPGRIKSLSVRQVEATCNSLYEEMCSAYGPPQFEKHTQTVFSRVSSLAGVRPSFLTQYSQQIKGNVTLPRIKVRVKQGQVSGVADRLRVELGESALIAAECGHDDLSIVFNGTVSPLSADDFLRNAWKAVQTVEDRVYEATMRLGFTVPPVPDVAGDLVDLTGLQVGLPTRFLECMDKYEGGRAIASSLRNLYRTVNCALANHTLYPFFLDLALHLHHVSGYLNTQEGKFRTKYKTKAPANLAWHSAERLGAELELLVEAVTQRYLGAYSLLNEMPAISVECSGGIQSTLLCMSALYATMLECSGSVDRGRTYGFFVLGKTDRINNTAFSGIVTIPQTKLLSIEQSLWALGHEIGEGLLVQAPSLRDGLTVMADRLGLNEPGLGKERQNAVNFATEVFCDAFCLLRFFGQDHELFLNALLSEIESVPVDVGVRSALAARAWVISQFIEVVGTWNATSGTRVFGDYGNLSADELNARKEEFRGLVEERWFRFLAFLNQTRSARLAASMAGLKEQCVHLLSYPPVLELSLRSAFRCAGGILPSAVPVAGDRPRDWNEVLSGLRELSKSTDKDSAFAERMELLWDLRHNAVRWAWDVIQKAPRKEGVQ